MMRKKSIYGLTEIGKYCIITIADSFQKESDLQFLFFAKSRIYTEKAYRIQISLLWKEGKNRLYLVKSRQKGRFCT